MTSFFEYNNKKVVTFLRLRNTHYYDGTNLLHIMDSFYFLIKNFVQQYDYDYRFFNLSVFGKVKDIRNYEHIRDSDVIIIPTEMEFMFHMKGRAPYFQLQRTNEWVNKIREILNDGKKRTIIILSSDKYDTIELFKSKVFPIENIDWYKIDENDFEGGLHHLKHLFIDSVDKDTNKEIDLCYWGTFKDDGRKDILKELRKKVNTFFIGKVGSWKEDMKFTNNFNDIIPIISKSRVTLCFNTTPNGFTSRYGESIGCNCIPLVWKDYDKNNDIVGDDWLRCNSIEEVIQKVNQLKDETFFNQKLSYVKEMYKKKTMDEEYYKSNFNNKLNEILRIV
jgi:hypothetical protein